MLYPIVGDYHRPPARAILQVLPMGCPLQLVPEPANPYDQYAVMVQVASLDIPPDQYDNLEVFAGPQGFDLEQILSQSHWHLGYVPRTVSQEVAEKLQGSCAPGTLAFNARGKPQVEVNWGG
jgi:hypothetical protein